MEGEGVEGEGKERWGQRKIPMENRKRKKKRKLAFLRDLHALFWI